MRHLLIAMFFFAASACGPSAEEVETTKRLSALEQQFKAADEANTMDRVTRCGRARAIEQLYFESLDKPKYLEWAEKAREMCEFVMRPIEQ